MLRNIASIIFALLLIPMTFGALLVVNVDRTLLSSEFYKSTLQKGDVYRKVINNGPVAVFDVITQSQGVTSTANLGPFAKEDVAGVITKSIPQAWFEENINAALDQGLGYVTGKRDNIDFKLSLVDIKANFSYYVGKDVLTKINSMPYCTTDQLRQLQSQGNVMAFLSQNCRPAGVDAQAIRRFIGGNNDPFAMIPSKVNLEELFKQNEQYFSQARGYVSMFMLAEKALIAVVLGVISLLILINIHHKKAMGIFVGVPVILASVGVIGLGKLIRFLSGSPLQESIKMPENAKNLLMDITGTFANQIIRNLFITSGLVALGAIVFMVVMMRVGRKTHPPLG